MSEYAVFVVGGDRWPAVAQSSLRPNIVVGPPTQFGGTDAWWSPEHLLLAAVASCFDATFRALMTRKGIVVDGVNCHARGWVDKTSAGLRLREIHLGVSIRVAAKDEKAAVDILADTERHCIVRNALAIPVRVEPLVNFVQAA